MDTADKKRWHANKSEFQGLIYDLETGENIAVSYDRKNTVLIAIAPEMLEALELCHSLLLAKAERDPSIWGSVAMRAAEQVLTEVELDDRDERRLADTSFKNLGRING